MNYTITEESMISYLFGEMDLKEKEQFEKALEASPKWREEFDQLSFMRKQLDRIEDEAIPQGVVLTTEPPSNKRAVLSWLRPIVAVAAAIALLMILASVTNMHMHNYEGGLSVTFGRSAPLPDADVQVQDANVNQIVQAALDVRDEQWRSQLAGLHTDLSKQVTSQENTLNEVSQQLQFINKKPNQSYLTLEQLDRYLSRTRKEDKDEMEKMISNLFEYMSINRDKDLQMIQAGFNDIRQTINLSDLERQQILASYQDINLNQ